jgi:hypothetical protein
MRVPAPRRTVSRHISGQRTLTSLPRRRHRTKTNGAPCRRGARSGVAARPRPIETGCPKQCGNPVVQPPSCTSGCRQLWMHPRVTRRQPPRRLKGVAGPIVNSPDLPARKRATCLDEACPVVVTTRQECSAYATASPGAPLWTQPVRMPAGPNTPDACGHCLGNSEAVACIEKATPMCGPRVRVSITRITIDLPRRADRSSPA